MEVIEDPVPISAAEAAVPEESAPEGEAQVDLSTLPAEIVGGPVSTKGSAEFKEEPYVRRFPGFSPFVPGADPGFEPSRYSCRPRTSKSSSARTPFLPLSPLPVSVADLSGPHSEFFELDPSFPISSLLVRNASGQPLRTIYFTSPIVRTLLLSNSYKRMRLTSCGVKVFSRQDSSKDGQFRCKWRIMSEGLEIMRPFMGERRIIKCGMETLKQLMGTLNVAIADVEDKAFVERIGEMETGSCVLEVKASGVDVECVPLSTWFGFRCRGTDLVLRSFFPSGSSRTSLSRSGSPRRP